MTVKYFATKHAAEMCEKRFKNPAFLEEALRLLEGGVYEKKKPGASPGIRIYWVILFDKAGRLVVNERTGGVITMSRLIPHRRRGSRKRSRRKSAWS
jgi:hypothetical protein